MAANPFDQFDEQKKGANPFDVFDAQAPSVAEDVTKAAASNLAGGGIDLAMMLPNIANAAVAGPQLLGRGLAKPIMAVGKAIGYIPEDVRDVPQNVAPWQPFYGSEDVEKALGTSYEPQTTEGKMVALPARIIGGVATAKGVQSLEKPLTALTKTVTGSRAPAPAQASAEEVKKLANQAYVAAEKQGGTLTPNFADKFVDDAAQLRPQTEQGRAIAGNDALKLLVDDMQAIKGQPISLQAAQEIDEALSARIDAFVDRTTGAITKEGTKLLETQNNFRRMIENAGPGEIAGGRAGFDALKEGRRLWSASSRLRDIERIVTRAEMTDNPATALRTGFRTLYNNPSRMRGYSAEEKALIKKAAESGVVGDLLRIAGSRLNPIIATATGAGGLTGAAASQATSMAARGAATKLQVNRAAKLANTVANNAVRPPMPANATTAQQLLPPVSASVLSEEGALLRRQQPKMLPAPMRALPAPEPESVPVPTSPQATTPLFQRVIQAESGGKQFKANGNPVLGPKLKDGYHAVGIAQIHPKTAKDAAKMAGLPYDAKRLYTDADYNAALGEAYLSTMQKKYGDERLALMAYNWGPGNVDRWLKKGADPRLIPKETRNYIAKILEG